MTVKFQGLKKLSFYGTDYELQWCSEALRLLGIYPKELNAYVHRKTCARLLWQPYS